MASIHKINSSNTKSWVLSLLVIALTSCKPTVNGVTDETIESFSTLQCQAIQLKKKRYDLSANLRDTEAKLPIDSVAITNINKIADSLKIQSLDLADLIKYKMDSIFETLKEIPEEKVIFYKRLEEKLTKIGCITQ